jgi:hypothetical protein
MYLIWGRCGGYRYVELMQSSCGVFHPDIVALVASPASSEIQAGTGTGTESVIYIFSGGAEGKKCHSLSLSSFFAYKKNQMSTDRESGRGNKFVRENCRCIAETSILVFNDGKLKSRHISMKEI